VSSGFIALPSWSGLIALNSRQGLSLLDLGFPVTKMKFALNEGNQVGGIDARDRSLPLGVNTPVALRFSPNYSKTANRGKTITEARTAYRWQRKAKQIRQ